MVELTFGQVLALVGVALLAGYSAGYATWRWWRQPRGEKPMPLPGMQTAIDHLDSAALMLSRYTWNPSQTNGMIVYAKHHIDAAQKALRDIPFKGKT